MTLKLCAASMLQTVPIYSCISCCNSCSHCKMTQNDKLQGTTAAPAAAHEEQVIR